MATNSGARRRPQKYPEELRDRPVRMVEEIRRETGESHGVVTREAKELGVGAEPLRGWFKRAEIDSGNRSGCGCESHPPSNPAGFRASTWIGTVDYL